MKKRIGYSISFLVLLLAEIGIGTFVHDRFIRPYAGDVLVAALLCSMARVFWPEGKMLPLWIFLFCAAVEILQFFDLPRLLGLEGTPAAIALGSTFDPADLLCYGAGSVAFGLAERLRSQRCRELI